MNLLKLLPNLVANKPKNNLLDGSSNGFIDPRITGGKPLPNVMYFGSDDQKPITIEPAQIGTEIQTRPLEQLPSVPAVINENPAIATSPNRDEIETENYLRESPAIAPPRTGKLYPATSGNTSDEIQTAINDLGSADMGREHSFKNRFLSGLWKGIQAWSANGGQGGLAGLAGAAVTGGAGSAASPSFHGELRRNDLKNKLYGRLGEARKQEEFNAAQDYKAAQTANIYADNEQKKLDSELKAKTAQEKLFETGRQKLIDRIYRRGSFSPKTAPQFEKDEMKRYGIDPEKFGDFDWRNPITKTVAGATYEWNRETQSFEESDLPKDGSKSLVDYEVTTPDGRKQKFTVTQDRAASFANQLATAGMQIEATNSRQNDQQQFTATQNLISNARQASETIQKIREQGEKAYKTPEEIEQKIQQFKSSLPAEIRAKLGN